MTPGKLPAPTSLHVLRLAPRSKNLSNVGPRSPARWPPWVSTHSASCFKGAEPTHTLRPPPHHSAQIPVSDCHQSAKGGAPQGPVLSPAAGLPLGGRACTDASGSALRPREEGAEATTPALTEPSAVVSDGGAPAEGGSRKGTDLTLAADPAPSDCLSKARYRLLRHAAVSFGSSDVSIFFVAEGGSPKGADLSLAADPAPGECLSEAGSEARYHLFRHAAVSFASSDISVFLIWPARTDT